MSDNFFRTFQLYSIVLLFIATPLAMTNPESDILWGGFVIALCMFMWATMTRVVLDLFRR